MIDFKKRVQGIENTKSYCSLLTKHYSTIDGTRTNCTTGVETSVKVHWVIDWTKNSKVIVFLDVVTGYESYYIDHLVDYNVLDIPDNVPCCICYGTKDKWDTLVVSRQQIKHIILDALNVYK